MEACAKLRHAKITPRKARLVANLIRGEKVGDARNVLAALPKKSSKIIGKLLLSVVANAEDRGIGDIDDLYVKEIFVDQGPVTKRFEARSMGRSNVIKKRTSHITIAVSPIKNKK